MITAKELTKFTDEIAILYKAGEIRSPVHLNGGLDQARALIKIFKKYKITKNDWVLGTWRSHWLYLLQGGSVEKLKQEILDGHSMHIFDDHFITSAIVGGIAPIAVGLAWAIKQQKSNERVFVFSGDMGINVGVTLESVYFCLGHKLPVTFIIEDNGLSVSSDVKTILGENYSHINYLKKLKNVEYYRYKRQYNHAGAFLDGDKRKVLF